MRFDRVVKCAQTHVEGCQRIIQVLVKIERAEQTTPRLQQLGSPAGIPRAFFVRQQILKIIPQTVIRLLLRQCSPQLESYPVTCGGGKHIAGKTNIVKTSQAAKQLFITRQSGSQQE